MPDNTITSATIVKLIESAGRIGTQRAVDSSPECNMARRASICCANEVHLSLASR